MNSSGPDQGQYLSVSERWFNAFFTTLPSVMCLLVNTLLLWTLRSKAIFRETPRYFLLFNLLLADTMHLFISQMLYLIASTHTNLHYPVCALITLSAEVFSEVSPLTVMLMSVERYIAVCQPLRHAALVGGRRIVAAMLSLWGLCIMNLIVRVGLLVQFPFHKLDSLKMSEYCSGVFIRITPLFVAYDEGYIPLLFACCAVVILWSYVMVVMVARKCASENSVKARNTLLLHLLQLIFSLSASIYLPLVVTVARTMALSRTTYVRVQSALYVFIMILPRSLSVLIYGIRDQTIRSTMQQTLQCKTG
ncbi:hypothetical protein WMY93_008214 [Mugilogobius chulae]|uniref:G-protein coupled receptors family 1 profile domain-containing protein n=1 Tax=Mugilogobius chulae TaxID=88201 RepID=A0AAW0PU33_9GOBI